MSRHSSDRNRTGIRVKHLQTGKAESSEVSSILSVSGFIEDSLMSRPSIFGSNKTPEKQRKKIFEGRSVSPLPAEHKEDKSSLYIQQLEEVEILITYYANQPVVLPDPLGISKHRHQINHPTQIQFQNQNSAYEAVADQRFDSHAVLKYVNQPLYVGSLQYFLKQPQHVREQLIERINPQGDLLERRMPSRPVMLGIQPHTAQPPAPIRPNSITEERRPARYTAFFATSSHTHSLHIYNPDRQLYLRLQEMEMETDKLRRQLYEKDRKEKQLYYKLQELAAKRDSELQSKDAEISQHIIQIEQLNNSLQQSRFELETAKQEAARYRQQRMLEKATYSQAQIEADARAQAQARLQAQAQAQAQAQQARVAEIHIQPQAIPPPPKQVAYNWQPTLPFAKAHQPLYQYSTQEEYSYLSPLSVNTSRNHSIDRSLPHFPFM